MEISMLLMIILFSIIFGVIVWRLSVHIEFERIMEKISKVNQKKANLIREILKF